VWDTYTESWGKGRLKEVVQKAVQVPWGPAFPCGAETSCSICLEPPGHHFPASANLDVPYLCGFCWAGLELDLEGVLEAVKGPGLQGPGGYPQLCKTQCI
jgi:hypothetical protein